MFPSMGQRLNYERENDLGFSCLIPHALIVTKASRAIADNFSYIELVCNNVGNSCNLFIH